MPWTVFKSQKSKTEDKLKIWTEATDDFSYKKIGKNTKTSES